MNSDEEAGLGMRVVGDDEREDEGVGGTLGMLDNIESVMEHAPSSHLTLEEKAQVFDIRADNLRRALLANREELMDPKLRTNIPWVWKHVELIGGEKQYRESLLAKWNTISIVTSLLATITIPLTLVTPDACFTSDDSKLYFQILFMVSSCASITCVFAVTFLNDMILTVCPRSCDTVYFVSLGLHDLPLNLLVLAIATCVAGLFVCFDGIALQRDSRFRAAFVCCIVLFGLVFVAVGYGASLMGARHLKAVQVLTEDSVHARKRTSSWEVIGSYASSSKKVIPTASSSSSSSSPLSSPPSSSSSSSSSKATAHRKYTKREEHILEEMEGGGRGGGELAQKAKR